MARKVQLKNKNGEKAYPVTSSELVKMSSGGGNLDGKLTELEKKIGILSTAGIKSPKTVLFSIEDVVLGAKVFIPQFDRLNLGAIQILNSEQTQIAIFYTGETEYTIGEDFYQAKVVYGNGIDLKGSITADFNNKDLFAKIEENKQLIKELDTIKEDFDSVKFNANESFGSLTKYSSYKSESQSEIEGYARIEYLTISKNEYTSNYRYRLYKLERKSYKLKTVKKPEDATILAGIISEQEFKVGGMFTKALLLGKDTESTYVAKDGDYIAILGSVYDASYYCQIQQGETINAVEEIENIKNGLLINKEAEVVIPDKINIVVGETIQLYYKGMFNCGNINNYEIYIDCQIGKAYPRYYELTPASNNVGEHDIKIAICKCDDCNQVLPTVVSEKTVKINVINKPTNNEEKSVTLVGDSTIETGSGAYAKEVQRHLSATDGTPTGWGLTNVKVCGRIKTKTDGDDSIELGYEGTGGWSWKDFATKGRKAIRFTVSGVSQLNIKETYTADNGAIFDIAEINVTGGVGNIRCLYNYASPNQNTPSSSGTLTRKSGTGDETITYTAIEVEEFSPFYNNDTESIDFMPYAEKYCNGKIDVIAFNLGINDCIGNNTNYEHIDSRLTYLYLLLDKYHEQFPDGKVLLGLIPLPSQNGGMAANYGAKYASLLYAYTRRVWYMNKKYIEISKDERYNSFVSIIPITAELDCDYAYPTEEKDVNLRPFVSIGSNKEIVGTNGVHYHAYSGCLMVADAIIRSLSSYL